MSSILIVEDEIKIAELHRDYLIQAGFEVNIIEHGDQVISWLKANKPDLVVLDVMLPGKDGLTLCREIREFSTVPIIMVTARVDEVDRIVGLEIGADDYVCKPVSPKELVARVRANVRRSVIDENKHHSDQDEMQDIVVDEDKYQASLMGEKLPLTAIEFQLLATLARHQGRIFSREQLMEKIYSDSRIVSDRTIDSHVKKIRKKLQDIDPDHHYIHSLYGVGFKWEKEPVAG